MPTSCRPAQSWVNRFQSGVFSIPFQPVLTGSSGHCLLCSINFLLISFERNDRRCRCSARHARAMDKLSTSPRKINKTALICFQVFFPPPPPDLGWNIPIRCFPWVTVDPLLSHNYVSATHTLRWSKWSSIMTIRWPTSLFQSPPQSPYEHEISRRLFRPYTSQNHNVAKGRYITSNDPRGYMYVLSDSFPKNIFRHRHRPVYEYPLLGQWIMMDMDDGYILWTGIWKGSYWLVGTCPGD